MNKLLVILLLFCTGCATYKPPLYDEYVRIVDTPHLPNVNDSSNRCSEYARALREYGHKQVYFYIRENEDGTYGRCYLLLVEPSPEGPVLKWFTGYHDWGEKIGKSTKGLSFKLIRYEDRHLYGDTFKEWNVE